MIRLNPAFSGEREEAPRFAVGQVVRHRRYGYRGVIVDFDHFCEADQAWYQKNQTQPDRDQPWYHVLVHGSLHATYAAQENLVEDPEPEPVSHPLVPLFFESFDGTRHIRNEEPWPGL